MVLRNKTATSRYFLQGYNMGPGQGAPPQNLRRYCHGSFQLYSTPRQPAQRTVSIYLPPQKSQVKLEEKDRG